MFENTFDNTIENVISALEQVWGFKLPKEYRLFLIEHNGGRPLKTLFQFKNEPQNGSLISFFFGITPVKYANLLYYINLYKDRYPNNMFPIASDQGGNLVLISVKNSDRGKIYFWDHELEADLNENEVPDYSNLTLIADNFEEFIKGLYSEEEVE